MILERFLDSPGINMINMQKNTAEETRELLSQPQLNKDTKSIMSLSRKYLLSILEECLIYMNNDHLLTTTIAQKQ